MFATKKDPKETQRKWSHPCFLHIPVGLVAVKGERAGERRPIGQDMAIPQMCRLRQQHRLRGHDLTRCRDAGIPAALASPHPEPLACGDCMQSQLKGRTDPSRQPRNMFLKNKAVSVHG